MGVKDVWLGQAMGPVAMDQDLCLLLALAFGKPFSLEEHLSLPRYSRDGIGPTSKQCVLPFLRSGYGGVRVGESRGNRHKERNRKLN